MKSYDKRIQKTRDIIKDINKKEYLFNNNVCWKSLDSSELILGSETAVRLAPSDLKGSSYTVFTSNSSLVNDDKITVIGEDIKKLKGKSTSFAKVVILKIKEPSEEQLYSTLKDLERTRFKVHLEGYMLRASTLEMREVVRISHDAVKKGLSFDIVGSSLIKEYKKNKYVENVEIIFVTGHDELIDKLHGVASGVKQITDALNHVFDDVEFDCHSCSFSEVCEEIDGMKEMHGKK